MKDFILDSHGTKIPTDPKRIPLLAIPKIHSLEEKGRVIHVLTVGIMPHGERRHVLVTVQTDDGSMAFKLPDWYQNWATMLVAQAMEGMNVFPCDVEFGFFQDYYAEIL